MGTVRIVAGRLKGRRLPVPDDPAVRPTSDRAREALFNILGQDLSGFDVLDLFAGSGALGFEAISRGARRAVFVESVPKVAAALRRTAELFGVDREARVVVARVEDVLDRARLGGPFHLVFADPPYAEHGSSRWVEGVDSGGLLRMEGTLVVERDKKSQAGGGNAGLSLVRTASYGRSTLDFFKYRNS
jgi:16S rRNA (guanine966-N2)-methyltransferase